MTLARLMAKLLASATRLPNSCLVVGDPNSDRRYWSVCFDGRKTGAHKAAWEFYHVSPVPDGLDICHSCDNGRCIEESHLLARTHAWNMQDRDRKGRNGTLGENSPLAKLTTTEAFEILRRTDEPEEILAAQFNVSVQTVERIHNRTSWKHLQPA